MKTRFILLFFAMTVFQLHGNAQCDASDFGALRALYLSADGDNWTDNTGWDLVKNNATPPVGSCDLGSMYGVTVNGSNRVTQLELSSNNLDGSIPTSIGNLSELTVLSLGDSSSLGNMNITGSLPDEICDLSKLSTLSIQFHNLTGSIPDSIGKLTNLVFINLHARPQTSQKLTGPIPSSFGMCTALLSMYMNSNDFSGNLPATLVGCTSLQNLYVENSISGALSFPSFLNNIPSLRRVRLTLNEYAGILPDLSNLNLIQFFITDNNISGPLPSYFSNWSLLQDLRAENNAFTGPLPWQWGSLSGLIRLHLSGNPIGGAFPTAWSGMTSMSSFRFNNCNLTDTLPTFWSNMPNLHWLWLSNNNLFGEIPDAFYSNSALKDVRLNDNNLTGSIPPSFGNMTPRNAANPTTLFLYNNSLTGCFDANLLNLCDPDSLYSINVNSGNSLDATWADFCATSAGICAIGSQTFCDISNGKTTQLSVDGNACIDGVLNTSEGIQLTPLTSAPTDPALGQMYFDGNTYTLRYWNGISWVAL